MSVEIRDMNVSSMLKGQAGGGFAAAAEPQDSDSGHRIFSVETATIANRIPRIQKRMTILVSGHPSFSKW